MSANPFRAIFSNYSPDRQNVNSILPIAAITFKEGLRRKVLYGVIVASLLLILFAVLISGIFMRDILKILLDICLSSISVSGLLVPFFLAINLLAGDIENRTIYTLLARNISRSSYIIGKFLGLALLSGTIIIILFIATLIAIWCASLIYPDHYFTNLSLYPIIISTCMAFLGVQVLNSTVLLWCTVTTSSFLATLLTISTYVIGHSVEDMVRFMSLKTSAVEMTPAVEVTVNAALYIFPNLAAFDLKQQAAYSLPIPFRETLFLSFYAIAYVSIILIITIFFFKRRDLP